MIESSFDVARLVGYESDAAFSKAFKRVVGANTGEYIQRGFQGHGNGAVTVFGRYPSVRTNQASLS